MFFQKRNRHSSRAFQYQPLDRSNKTSFRLLKVLHEKSRQGYVQCELFHTTTDRKIGSYTCLSYVWEPREKDYSYSTSPHVIIVNKARKEIHPNLHDFLHVAQQKYAGEPLWIDALCIDQSNIVERNHQVSQMGEIYSRAKQVIAWLGSRDPRFRSTNPLWYLQCKLYELQRPTRSQMAFIKPSAFTWDIGNKSDMQFMYTASEYSSRAWITQELALARHVFLLFDTVELDLTGNATAIESLEQALHEDFTNSTIPNWPSPLEFTPVFRIWRLAVDERWQQRVAHATPAPDANLSLFTLLSQFRNKQSRHGRDRIYSLRYLCSEGQSLRVNYAMPPHKLLQEVIRVSHRPTCLCIAITLAAALGVEKGGDWDSVHLDIDLERAPDTALSASSAHRICGSCGANAGSTSFPGLPPSAIHVLCLQQLCTGVSTHLLVDAQHLRIIAHVSPSGYIDSGVGIAPLYGAPVWATGLNSYGVRVPGRFLITSDFWFFKGRNDRDPYYAGCRVRRGGKVKFGFE